MAKETLQLSLPYEQVKVLPRPQLRSKFSVTSRVSYWIPFNKIAIREGFNKRKDLGDIRSLADYIEIHNLPEPFVLDVVSEDKAYVEKGHRRFAAISLLISENRFDPESRVEFFPNNTEVTEFKRMVDQIKSNNYHSKPLTPLEQSAVVFEAKYNYGREYSNEELARELNVSRQTIDNLILIAKADDSVKDSIKLGDMSFTDAVAFVRSQKKAQKEANKKEEESHKSSAAPLPLPEDPLRKDIEELHELEQEAEEYKANAAESRKRQQLEKLYEVANEVLVNKEALIEQIGKRLAAPACAEWTEDFVDDNSGEVITIDKKEVIFDTNVLIDEEVIEKLIEADVKSVFINKHVIAAPSVITEPVASPEKSKYDKDRPEIAQVLNAIGLNDKVSVRVEKLDISDQDKKDLTDYLKWQMSDLMELREWVHNNKKQNKRGF